MVAVATTTPPDPPTWVGFSRKERPKTKVEEPSGGAGGGSGSGVVPA